MVKKKRSSSGRSSGKGGKKKSSAKKKKDEQVQREPDVLDAPAMDNLYFIAHTPAMALDLRGYKWPHASKKKGKKKKRKK